MNREMRIKGEWRGGNTAEKLRASSQFFARASFFELLVLTCFERFGLHSTTERNIFVAMDTYMF